jgi:hypothetical protein
VSELRKSLFNQAIDVLTDRDQKEAAAAPRNVVLTVRNLRVHADHYTTSEIVAGVANGSEVHIDLTWSDGKEHPGKAGSRLGDDGVRWRDLH